MQSRGTKIPTIQLGLSAVLALGTKLRNFVATSLAGVAGLVAVLPVAISPKQKTAIGSGFAMHLRSKPPSNGTVAPFGRSSFKASRARHK